MDLQLKGVVLAVSDQSQTWTTAGSIAADFTKEDKIIQWEKHEKVKHIKETESNTPTADKGARLSKMSVYQIQLHSTGLGSLVCIHKDAKRRSKPFL